MKTIRRLLAVTACLALAVPAAAAPAASGSGSRAAQLTDFSCDRAVQPLLRGMSVTAVMRSIPATHKLEMRALLLRAYKRYGRYRVFHVKGLGTWVSPRNATLGQQAGDVWNVSFPVVGLPAPAYYRLRVAFRWLELGRRVLAAATLTSASCHQLELRPDLVAASLTVNAAAQAGEDRYVAVVRNRGLSGAGPFEVELSGSSGELGTQTVGWLGPHATRRVRFLAAACTAGSLLTLAVDPSDQVLDYDRANNVLSVTCPALSGAGARGRRLR